MLSTKSELFVAVAEEEQEVVAGGSAIAYPLSFPLVIGDYSSYGVSDITKVKMTAAGPGGAQTLNTTKIVSIDSTALIGGLFQRFGR